MKLNIVLVEPEIPQNTGNIARTCAAIGAKLHLVKPLGFEISDKYLKRAGLDYWDKLEIETYENLQEFLNKTQGQINNMFYLTTKANKCYTDIDYTKYQDEIYLVFGKETKGLPEWLLRERIDNAVRIPMKNNIRSLNLSNSVNIVAYEVMRQWDFGNLQETSTYLN